MSAGEHRGERPPHDDVGALTVPNALTLLRFAGSGVLVWLASEGASGWFMGVFAALLLTDWLDGKLAILLHQRTELGARLDSIGDAILYACLLAGIVLLEPQFVRAEAVPLAVMLGSYALMLGASLARFRRLPAYHTFGAKTAWWLATIGAITLLAGGPPWPARVALVAVTLANLEAVAISFVLREWRADVRSIVHAMRERGRDRESQRSRDAESGAPEGDR